MDNLKPCPFCGGEAEIYTHLEFGAVLMYHVECYDCNAKSCNCLSEEKAIEAWNRRADNGN